MFASTYLPLCKYLFGNTCLAIESADFILIWRICLIFRFLYFMFHESCSLYTVQCSLQVMEHFCIVRGIRDRAVFHGSDTTSKSC